MFSSPLRRTHFTHTISLFRPPFHPNHPCHTTSLPQLPVGAIAAPKQGHGPVHAAGALARLEGPVLLTSRHTNPYTDGFLRCVWPAWKYPSSPVSAHIQAHQPSSHATVPPASPRQGGRVCTAQTSHGGRGGHPSPWTPPSPTHPLTHLPTYPLTHRVRSGGRGGLNFVGEPDPQRRPAGTPYLALI